MIRAAALALVLASAAAARADGPTTPPASPPPSKPDQNAVDQAADANFDDDAPHHGFRIGGMIGIANQTAFGITPASGFGGGAGVRLGAMATRRIALLFAIDGTTYLSKNDSGPVELNTSLVLTLGPQIYLRDATWVRFGFGFASFQRRQQSSTVSQHLYSGPGAQVGVGFEVATFDDRRVALSAEVTVTGAFYAEGVINGGLLGIGIAYK